MFTECFTAAPLLKGEAGGGAGPAQHSGVWGTGSAQHSGVWGTEPAWLSGVWGTESAQYSGVWGTEPAWLNGVWGTESAQHSGVWEQVLLGSVGFEGQVLLSTMGFGELMSTSEALLGFKQVLGSVCSEKLCSEFLWSFWKWFGSVWNQLRPALR